MITMNYLRNLTRSIFLICISSTVAFGQVESPPSLALGVAGVVGGKGSIDVDVLAEVIASKQAELKKEFIKKTIYSGISQNNYAIWEYVYKSLDILLESESKEAIKKNMLENSANLALVYGFSEFYLQLSYKFSNNHLHALLDKFDAGYDDRFATSNSSDFELLLSDLKQYQHGNADQGSIRFSSFFIDLVYDVLKSNDELKKKLGFLDGSYPLGKDYYEDEKVGSAYHRCRNRANLQTEIKDLRERMIKEVGVIFDYYILIKKIKDSDQPLEEIIGTIEKKVAKTYVQSLDSLGIVNLFRKTWNQFDFDQYGDLEGYTRQLLGGINVSDTLTIGALVNTLKSADMKLLIDDLVRNSASLIGLSENDYEIIKRQTFRFLSKKTDTVFNDLQSISPSLSGVSSAQGGGPTAIAISQAQSTSQSLSLLISDNLGAFTKFKQRGADNFSQDDIYYLENSIGPLVTRLVAEAGFDPIYVEVANAFDELITLDLLKKLRGNLPGNLANLSADISQFGDLLDFITKLDQLDKVETYELVLSTIQNAGELFEDKKIGLYLTTITENLDKYTIIDTEANKVEVAVEDIISRIYDKYANRQSGVVSLYFSIGISQAFNSNYNFMTSTLLPDSSGFVVDTLNSLAYAGEKVGLKLKLLDFKKRNSYDIGEVEENWGILGSGGSKVGKFRSKNPVVSDIYAIGYFSGLIYKIADLVSEEEFRDPIWGVGLGVAFFNSLDLNITYNRPIRSNNDFFDSIQNQEIWSIGFDIKITEYLAAVKKKRNAD